MRTSRLTNSADYSSAWGSRSAYEVAITFSGNKGSKINLQRDGSKAKPYQVRQVQPSS